MNDWDQAVLDDSLYGFGPTVHLAGAGPSARCGSRMAPERHVRHPAEVTCVSCMQRMTDAELEQVS